MTLRQRKELFWIQFAGLYCRVVATSGMKHIFTKYFSGPYLTVTNDPPILPGTFARLTISQRDPTEFESSVKISKDGIRCSMVMHGSVHFYYPLLSNLLQRIFMQLYYARGGIIFHASAVESGGKAYVFVGESGKGKTTIVKLLHKLNGLNVIADNQVFIRRMENQYVVFPFPFSQFHNDGTATPLPVAGFYILYKSNILSVRLLTFIESVRALEHEIQILSAGDIPTGLRVRPELHRTIFDIAQSIRIYRLFFSRRKGIWEAIYGFSKAKKFHKE